MHSASDAHAVRQALPAALHVSAPGHAVGVPAWHVPEPLHVFGTSMFPVHVDPHEVPLAGNTHAPVASQSVAPHVPPVVHDAAQQWVPEPDGPQTPAAHWSFAEHAAPAGPFATHVPLAPRFLQ
jgi:hypothetical protein